MRVLTFAAIAGAIVSASPASAQYNEAAPATNEANAAAPANEAAPAPAAPATVNDQTATALPAATTPAESGSAPVVAEKSGFPWGVLGLLGLVGLFGRKRSSS